MSENKKTAAGKKSGGKKPAGSAGKRSGGKTGQSAKSRGKGSENSYSPAHLIVMPLTLAVLAILLVIFFFPRGDNGSVGGLIAVAFRYLFGGGRFLLPLFLAYAAIFWRRNWREGRLVLRSLLQCVVFLLSDSLFCYFPYLVTRNEPAVTWELASTPGAKGIGGGIAGNFIGGGLVDLIGFAAAGVLLLLFLLFLGCFLVGSSPFALFGKVIAVIKRKRDVRREILEEEREKENDDALRERERERILEQRRRKAEQKARRDERRTARRDGGAPSDEDGRNSEKRSEKKTKQTFDPDVELGEDDAAEEGAGFPDDGEFDTPFPPPEPLGGDGEKKRPVRPPVWDTPEDLPEEPSAEDPADPLADFFAGFETSSPEAAPEGETADEGELPPKKNPEEESLEMLFAEDFDKLFPDLAESGDGGTNGHAPEAIPVEKSPLVGSAGQKDVPSPPPPYRFPPITLLKEDKGRKSADTTAEIIENARKLEETLRSFRVNTKVENYSRGPTVTRYELTPEKGVRVRSIANLVDDIALNLAAEGVRIEAPIPGKAAVGVEVPNRHRETVYLRTLFDDPRFKKSEAALAAALGVNVGGEPVFMDLAKMPHLLIAGTTGSGKSVCMNCLILSLLFKYSPENVKMIMIDPKKVEFKIYNGLPHLITPVVSEAKKAAGSLAWAVTEMERRYEIIESVGVRDIKSYNNYTKNDPEKEHMPYLVLFIDELADLMFVASSEVEESICRIAQKGRAAGLHLVIGTQRPSVDVITGLIKANVPSRIAFSLPSQTDSRTVIDVGGAEKLIGMGDMLVAPVGLSKPVRLQGPFVSDEEVEAVVTFIKDNAPDVRYDSEVIETIEREAELCGNKGKKGTAVTDEDAGGEMDPMLEAAIDLAVESGKISTSLIQRRLSLGYGRAAKLIDRMEKMGIVSPPDGQKPRTVLLTPSQWAEQKMREESP